MSTLEGEFDKVIAAFDLSDEQVKTFGSTRSNAAYLDEKGKALS
jgi:hypothetical protein